MVLIGGSRVFFSSALSQLPSAPCDPSPPRVPARGTATPLHPPFFPRSPSSALRNADDHTAAVDFFSQRPDAWRSSRLCSDSWRKIGRGPLSPMDPERFIFKYVSPFSRSSRVALASVEGRHVFVLDPLNSNTTTSSRLPQAQALVRLYVISGIAVREQ